MAITQPKDTALSPKRERPRPSDIKLLFERYRRASRRLYDSERPVTSWPSPDAKADEASAAGKDS